MTSYPFDHIILNGREIRIDAIVAGLIKPQSDFELHTLEFIRDWLNEVPSYTLKTSGSTGIPKNILVTRYQMISSALATQKALDLKPDYTSLICLDTRFIAGKMMVVRSFVTHMKMVIQEPSKNPLVNLNPGYQIDFAALVPYQVEEILDSSRAQLLNGLKTIIIGGAPLNQSASAQLMSYRCKAYLTYGMTETLSHVALSLLTPKTENAVFDVLPEITIATDARGCLVIEVPYLTEKVITNDLVEIISSKKFRWLGRWDNIINSGGAKVNPEKIEFQIEKIFRSLNISNNFFVAGTPDKKIGEEVTLFIEGQKNDALVLTLQNRLKSVLERYEMPRLITFLSEFHYTSTRKLDRKAILKAYLKA